MKNTLETRLGLFVALIVIAAVIIVNTLGGIEKFKKGIRLHALFDSAQELKVGDRVKMAGVEIGRVEEIVLAEDKVKVTLKLRAGAPVKSDSVASIRFAGLMGQNFVHIEFGTPGGVLLRNDQTISTVEQADLSVIMAKLDNVATGVENLTKSFSGDTIDNLFGPFTAFLKQNQEPLSASIANLRSVSAKIASGEGSVGKMIYDETLYTTALGAVSNLNFTAGEAKATLAEARKIIDGVNAGQGSIGKMVKDEKLYAEAAESMTQLKEILKKMNSGEGTVGKLINDQEFYKNAKLTLQKVDKATEGLEDQGPLSVLGILANGLF
jgi:phospholipid/cholesterol/gamma-HCH transport system substrate-binding protein